MRIKYRELAKRKSETVHVRPAYLTCNTATLYDENFTFFQKPRFLNAINTGPEQLRTFMKKASQDLAHILLKGT